MNDGQIVWQCQCQRCDWKGSIGVDLDASREEARMHLAEAHPTPPIIRVSEQLRTDEEAAP